MALKEMETITNCTWKSSSGWNKNSQLTINKNVRHPVIKLQQIRSQLIQFEIQVHIRLVAKFNSFEVFPKSSPMKWKSMHHYTSMALKGVRI